MAKNAAKLVNATKIPELFPPVQFAFYGNTITRYRQKLLKKKTNPKLDIIFAVDDVQAFHKENV